MEKKKTINKTAIRTKELLILKAALFFFLCFMEKMRSQHLCSLYFKIEDYTPVYVLH